MQSTSADQTHRVLMLLPLECKHNDPSTVNNMTNNALYECYGLLLLIGMLFIAQRG